MKPSREARFDGSFEGFRDEARALLTKGVAPEGIVWVAEDDPQDTIPGLLAAVSHPPPPPAGAHGTPHVPRALLALAERASCHRDPQRFALLYRVLWRVLHEEHDLLARHDDEDVAQLHALERAVMREVAHLDRHLAFHTESRTHGEHWVAYARPHHHVARLLAPRLLERFRGQTWSVLMPHESLHGDRQGVHFGPGVPEDLFDAAPSVAEGAAEPEDGA